MVLDQETVDRVSAAIESAQVGYSLRLTRLVDGVETFTLTYSDGTPPLTFDNIDDGYLNIRERKRRAQAAAVIAALETPAIDGGRFAEWSLATIARQCRAQSREQLDPEFSQFMAEVSNRLFGALADRATIAGNDRNTVLASRHNDELGECEPVFLEPEKVRLLREKMAAPRDPDAHEVVRRRVLRSGVRIDAFHYGASFLHDSAEVMAKLDTDHAGHAHIYSADTGEYLGVAICPELLRCT